MSKYLFIIIATVGCASAVPFDQRFPHWQRRGRRTDLGTTDVPGVIPLEGSLEQTALDVSVHEKNLNLNNNHNVYNPNPFHNDHKKNRSSFGHFDLVPSLGNLDKAPETVDFAPKLLNYDELKNNSDYLNAGYDAIDHLPKLHYDGLSIKNEVKNHKTVENHLPSPHHEVLSLENEANHHKTVENHLPSLHYEGISLENEADIKNVVNNHLPSLDHGGLSIKNEANHHKTVENHLPSLHYEGISLENEADIKNVGNNHLPSLDHGELSIKNEANHHKTVGNHLPRLHHKEGSIKIDADHKHVDNHHIPRLHHDELNIGNEVGVSTETSVEVHKDTSAPKSENIENDVTLSAHNHKNNHLSSTNGLNLESKSDYQHIGDALVTSYRVSEHQTSSQLKKKIHSQNEGITNDNINVQKNKHIKNKFSDSTKVDIASEHESSEISKKSSIHSSKLESVFDFEHKNHLDSHEKSSEEHKTTQKIFHNCPNAKKKNHITEIFTPNISSLPFEDDLKGRFDPDSSKSSKIYVGEDVTVCWTEITTIKENKLIASPNRQVIREYAISFENSATIPDEYLECSKMEGEISDDKRICDSKFPSTIDQDTRKSRVINTTTKSREGDLDVTQIKVIKCGVGSLVTREVFRTGKNDSKRIEIKVSPLTKKTKACLKEDKGKSKVVAKKFKPECSEEACTVKHHDNDDDDEGALSTGTLTKIVSTTPTFEESSEMDNVSCSGLHCPDVISSISIDSTTETIEVSVIENHEASISSTEDPSTLASATETVTQSSDVSSRETLPSHDLKKDLLTTHDPDDLDQDYSGSGSGDCSEEAITEETVALEPNDDHVRINKAGFVDIVKVQLTKATESTPIDVERRLHELTTTSETRKSTLPINSSTLETDKGEKHRLALKIRVSLEQIDNEKPRKIADIEKNLTLDEPLSDHGNHTLMQQLDALNKSSDSLEAIKEIFNCSLLEKFSKDITSTEKKTYRKESEQDLTKLIGNVSEAIGNHKEHKNNTKNKNGRHHKNKRSVEGIEELGSWSNERFMKLQSGGQLHSITELTLFRNVDD